MLLSWNWEEVEMMVVVVTVLVLGVVGGYGGMVQPVLLLLLLLLLLLGLVAEHAAFLELGGSGVDGGGIGEVVRATIIIIR